MSDTPDTLPAFEPYECSLGTVIGYEGSTYRIATPDGRVIGIATPGTPSPENVEADIANPPPPPPAPVPASVPLWAFRQVLIEDGLLATVQAAVTGNAVLLNFLEYGNFVDRASPSLASLAAALGKSESEVDEFFRRAGALKL